MSICPYYVTGVSVCFCWHAHVEEQMKWSIHQEKNNISNLTNRIEVKPMVQVLPHRSEVEKYNNNDQKNVNGNCIKKTIKNIF